MANHGAGHGPETVAWGLGCLCATCAPAWPEEGLRAAATMLNESTLEAAYVAKRARFSQNRGDR